MLILSFSTALWGAWFLLLVALVLWYKPYLYEGIFLTVTNVVFGVVLYPARYGVSGVMTFTCNLEGVVYEKDLGPATEQIATSMTTYNPDASWKKSDVK